MKNFLAFKLPILAGLFILLTAETCEVTRLSAPCTVTPGVPFPIVSTVVSHLDAEAVIPVYYYLSYDRFINPEDILLGQDNIQLTPFGSQTSVFIASLGSDVYSGIYYIIAKPYESNSFMYREIEVIGQPNNGADYVPTNLRFEGWRFYFSLQNVGLLEASGCKVHGYLSKDLVVDASDSLVYSSGNLQMPGHSRKEINNAVIDTAGIPFGSYNFILAADATNIVTETVETNNFLSVPIFIPNNLNLPAEERMEAPIVNMQSSFTFTVWPNPASDYVNIAFQLDEPAMVSYAVHDQAGRMVSEMSEQELSPGDYSERVSVREVLNGVYFVRAAVNGEQVTKKIVVQR
ncbi:MAG: T9SS type A sorting domain-containing protein [Saprospiraceae bacterium]